MGAAAVPLGDGRTVIAGGMVAGAPTDTVVIYDPIAKSFSAAGQLIAARVGHTATLLADGRILVTGGTIGSQISADVELFDPASGTSTLVALMGQPRTAHAAARLADGTVLIVGGATTDGAVLQSAEIFNPASGTVALLASSLQRRRAKEKLPRPSLMAACSSRVATTELPISVPPKRTIRRPRPLPGSPLS